VPSAHSSAHSTDSNRGKRGKKVKAMLSPEELEKFQQKVELTGVVYLSRIPPFMQPHKLRHLLSEHGEIGRVYLAPESSSAREKRMRFGGNRKEKFVEGWVEFINKNEAKRVATLLNNRIIGMDRQRKHPLKPASLGGKTTSFYHDDIWTIKYLPKFKWHHLTERIALEKASREQKLRAELARSKRENEFYLANVDKAKMIQSIEERKRASAEVEQKDTKKKGSKRPAPDDSAPAVTNGGGEASVNFEELRRRFKQRKPVAST